MPASTSLLPASPSTPDFIKPKYGPLVGSRLALAIGLTLTAVTAAQAVEPRLPEIHLENLRAQATFDGVIVKFRDGSAAAERSSNGRLVRGERIRRLSQLSGLALQEAEQLAIGAVLIRSASRAMSADQVLSVLENLATDPEIEYAQPNGRMYAQFAPNDALYAQQWHYQDSFAGIRLPSAWNVVNGTGITVAVLDTGITYHPDLHANVVQGYDFISDPTEARDGDGRDGDPQDQGDWFAPGECPFPSHDVKRNSTWHGTHVAGTIAALTHNATGVAGVAFGAKVQPLRVLGRCGGSTADIAQAISWAAGLSVEGVPDNPTPAKVINLSLGAEGYCDTATRKAIELATVQGALVVTAAGNSNSGASFTPASCKHVLNVAALDRAGNRAAYSNYGSRVDVAAPGGAGGSAAASERILSTHNDGLTVPGNSSYAWKAGTSMAAPHVAGLAALVRSFMPSWTPAEVETFIKATARPIPGKCDEGCGTGLIDASQAIKKLNGPSLAKGKGLKLVENLKEHHFKFVVPDLTKDLRIEVRGGLVDIYVQLNEQATTTRYQCRTYTARGVSSCYFERPAEGIYEILVVPQRGFTGATLIADYALLDQ